MNLFYGVPYVVMALIVAAIGTAGCQHESQAEHKEVRTVSYRAVNMQSQTCP